MKNRNLFLSIAFLLGFSHVLYSQTYYSDSKNVDVTLTIKEPYKPIDYAKIGQDLTNTLEAEQQRREALKRYYDDVTFQTINSIYSNTLQCSNSSINSKLLYLQSLAIEELNLQNRLLKAGRTKPNQYEGKIRNIYYKYMSGNQVFLNISSYYMNKTNAMVGDTLINKFNTLFNATINSIGSFSFDDYGLYFYLNGLYFTLNGYTSYSKNNINDLYTFITSSCEGSFYEYKASWDRTH